MIALRCLSLPLSVLFILNACAPLSMARSVNNHFENSLQRSKNNSAWEPVSCQVYCYGELLHTVQMAHIYKDSKTFVDMKMKFPPEQTTANFTNFMALKSGQPTVEEIREFVDSNFEDVGKEFEPWSPNDWKEHPSFLDKVKDPDLKQWASDLNAIWKELGRKMIDDVHKNSEYYSIIPVDNPVIVPGGRFREFYYWDSYWIIRGLLYSEMTQTARGMLENFMSVIQRYGFIPNGGRIYYSKRSQPPLLAAMIKSYVDFTKDQQFAVDSIDVLEHEFQYWMNNHMIEINGHSLARYGDYSLGPRPESYREDVETGSVFKTEEERENYYSELKAACEAGFDFSSRWFLSEDGQGDVGNLLNIKTRSIVPVELNAILYWNAKILAEFFAKAKNIEKSAEYEDKAEKLFEAIQAIHWSEEDGVWLDYDLMHKKQHKFFVATNISPLWVGAFNQNDKEAITKSVLKYIERLGLDDFPGGVPTTLNKTGEQWDLPNVWPPLQYILVEGLNNLNTPDARSLSAKWAHRWVKSNFNAYGDKRAMYEKYDAEVFGGHGGGGEYEVQTGFGWSNGVIIEFLAKHGNDITLSTDSGAADNIFSIISLSFLTIFVTQLGRYFSFVLTPPIPYYIKYYEEKLDEQQ